MLLSLTNGGTVQVDPEDYAAVSAYRWGKYCQHGHWYALAKVNRRTLYMHRILTGAKRGQRVDHKNGNGLDNRRANIRIATPSQNGANQGLHANNTSGYKGVCLIRKRGRWGAFLQVDRRQRHLGEFVNPVDAARAYDAAALAAFGEFAVTNAALGLLPS